MGQLLYCLVIKPVYLILEVIFSVSYRITQSPGLSLIFVSLAVSILTMPLYRRADAIQEKERNKKRQMEKWVSHIQKHFKGDERVMMLNTYYRQQNYKPVYALRSSLSLLLQIPFFIAAYRYLSGLLALRGASFLWIRDLGAPDQLFTIGSFSVNLMPILMTLVNILSGMIYAKDYPLKEKLQLYGIALVFLVLLYKSPSGLVFYWTMNNVFSLIKNIYKKYIRLPRGINIFLIPAAVCLSMLILLLTGRVNTVQRRVLGLLVIAASFFPLITALWRSQMKESGKKRAKHRRMSPGVRKNITGIFVLSGVLLTLLAGILIPSGVIGVSPAEFVNLHDYHSPLYFVSLTTAVAAGFFLLWGGVLYYLASPDKRRIYSAAFWSASVIALTNYLFFGKKLGTVSTSLVFDTYPVFSPIEIVLNICVFLALLFTAVFVWKKRKSLVIRICSFLILAVTAICTVNAMKIHAESTDLKEMAESLDTSDSAIQPVIHLSKGGKNVIVFMLDRAISGYVPLIFEEDPALKDAFSGFVYYPNTISYGLATNYGAPALFGGYEYTPLEMNSRSDELLADKHDEALKVMPALFWENGYDVTVCDPPYAGYNWHPDLSIYSQYEGMHTYNLEGLYTSFSDEDFAAFTNQQQNRNFFFYSLMRMLPVPLQTTVYDSGNYFSTATNHAVNDTFLDWYSIIDHLTELTFISDDDTNTFYMSNNKTAHDVMMLERPEYIPAVYLSSTERNTVEENITDGVTVVIRGDDETEQAHYDCNMAAYREIAKWIEYLKENNVYDNTRLMIVADHGYRLGQYYGIDQWEDNDIECLNPVLLVKDFNADEDFHADWTFMTNADVPALAVENLIKNPENPFTGKAINSDEKDKEQYVLTDWLWDIEKNNGTTFAPDSTGHWYAVKDNLFDISNWRQLEEQPSN